MHCSSELHLVDKVVRAPLHEPPLQGPRAPRGGNKGRFVGTGGRRWRAIIIVIIPIKKLIIGPGSPPADPIMGWFSSQPFIPPSLHSFTTEVRLQILSSPPHSPVVKAVAWSWFSAPCRRLWKHSSVWNLVWDRSPPTYVMTCMHGILSSPSQTPAVLKSLASLVSSWL